MQPLGPDCEESCFIKPKTQMFHPTVATKLSTNAESLNLELAPLTYCHSFRIYVLVSFSIFRLSLSDCLQIMSAKKNHFFLGGGGMITNAENRSQGNMEVAYKYKSLKENANIQAITFRLTKNSLKQFRASDSSIVSFSF